MRNKFIGILYAILIISISLNACQNDQELYYARYYVNGKGIYEQHCQNCHGKEGQGLRELIPPLTDSVFLVENKDQLACFVKYGLAKNIAVHGKIYEEKMPAVNHLANIDIAAVVTYITNSFGNNQGLYDVKAVNTDLINCN